MSFVGAVCLSQIKIVKIRRFHLLRVAKMKYFVIITSVSVFNGSGEVHLDSDTAMGK
jgi:hypothetical protein